MNTLLDDFQNQGGFYRYTSTQVKPRPFYYRLCWHIWSEFFTSRVKQGPAAQADMDAAREVWADLDEDAREFLRFTFRFDRQWSNVKDCARVYAVKRRHTLTSTMRAFDQANRQLAITRGIIDNWKGDNPDE